MSAPSMGGELGPWELKAASVVSATTSKPRIRWVGFWQCIWNTGACIYFGAGETPKEAYLAAISNND